MPTPRGEQHGRRDDEQQPSSSDDEQQRDQPAPPRREMQRNAGELVGDVAHSSGRGGRIGSGGIGVAHAPSSVAVVVPARQIGGARPRAELFQQHVVAAARAAAATTAESWIVDVAEDDRLGRAGLLAGGHDFVRRAAARFSLSAATCAASMRCVQ